MTVEKLITDHIDIWSSALQTRSAAGRGSNGKIDLYGIKKLRELILELAVRGKLVPQDPNDEPASELLKRIAAEKAELVKQGKIKKQKPLPEISEDEKPFELPVGWEWTTLSEIATINPKIEVTDDEQDISFVPMPCISTRFDGAHDQEIKSWGKVKKGYTHFADGDIAIAKITPCFENSKAVIFKGLKGGVGVGTTELHVARPISSELNLQYILLNIKSPHYLSMGESMMTGSAGQKRVPRNFFENYPLPFPPIAEQIRIVETFSQLMTICDQLEQQSLSSLDAHQQLVKTLLATLTDSQNAEELAENWARISQYFGTLFTNEASIDALKQTILQLAVMGKLVPQDPNDEPASELLKRIEQEKAQLVKEGKIKKQKPLPPVSDEEKPFELPVGWGWVRLGDIGTISGGGTPSKNNEEYWLGDIPWLSPKDMKVDYISTAEFNISELAVANSSVRIIPNNSILFVVRGMILAHTFPVAINKKEVTINQDMKSITSHLFNMDFLLNLMKGMSRNVLSLVDRSSHGTCKLVSEKLFNLQIPLPPLSEQSRINNRIEELVSLCDTLKSRLQSAQQTQLHLADALTDAALN
ncbi:restriction endonuclease subunit S [Morganella morganii subsp. morganii]|uniref:restriction endonuclease subunit S n=1 Tax=Morganella morganii TaxID=582 RepID=UPI0015F57D2A|nr:restriction endonuclease subunit S [Morganella morganii]ELA8474087.1 restriction endonuclease subunit S [Morganella morganii]MBA5855337.1 restriction endonuclease subunit S [Morganella morganii]MBT0448181.1 restriction endonuclease subunit S [Morganella morganii subsp. morganii]MBT0451560.1 restriction endonuclease subunit S [Morganella morganii subsp. morganii]MBT0509670.1 restriction endonuclease subunit S [Morganella morganii subsp. morganii]